MDWTVTGLLAGVTVLAGGVAYESIVLVRSGPDRANAYQFSAVLIPARERAPIADTNTTTSYSVPGNSSALLSAPRLEPPAIGRRDQVGLEPTASKLPLADPGNYAGRPKALTITNESATASLNSGPPVGRNEVKAPPPPQIGADSWRVVTTSKASYFNLGGHVNKDGVVDSLASSYLRDALKKHRNYPTLPAPIKAYIDAPNINLTKIAGYRTLLGIDDKKMEEEQGVKFIKIASRGLDIDNASQSDVPDINVAPFDLDPLDQMNVELRRDLALGLVP
jgi:hypothetical protein